MSLKKCMLFSFLLSLFIILILSISFNKNNTYDLNNNIIDTTFEIDFDFSNVNIDKILTMNNDSHYLNDLIEYFTSWLNINISNSQSQLIYFALLVFICSFIIFNFSLIPYFYYRIWHLLLKDR